MSTRVVRIEEAAAHESAAAAAVLGQTQGDLLARAWDQYKASPEFKHAFTSAQKAIATGDLSVIGDELQAAALARAEERASRTRTMRD